MIDGYTILQSEVSWTQSCGSVLLSDITVTGVDCDFTRVKSKDGHSASASLGNMGSETM